MMIPCMLKVIMTEQPVTDQRVGAGAHEWWCLLTDAKFHDWHLFARCPSAMKKSRTFLRLFFYENRMYVKPGKMSVVQPSGWALCLQRLSSDPDP